MPPSRDACAASRLVGNSAILMPREVASATWSTDAAIYGIRPEHLHIDPNGIEIEVIVLEPTGSETQVIGRIGTQSINGIFRERITAQPGSKIKVAPDLSVVHLFNKDGKRVN